MADTDAERDEAVVVFLPEGDQVALLQGFIKQALQEQGGSPAPLVLPAWAAKTRYLLHAPADLDEASPDGDAMQAFDWASNPPGLVVKRLPSRDRRSRRSVRLRLQPCSGAELRAAKVLQRRGCHVRSGIGRLAELPLLRTERKTRPRVLLVGVALPPATPLLVRIADLVGAQNREANHKDALLPYLEDTLAPLAAAVTIQAATRSWLCRRHNTFCRLLLRRRAALCIQAWWRADHLKQRLCMLRAVRTLGALCSAAAPADTFCMSAEAFQHLQQQSQSSWPLLRPEQDLCFAFDHEMRLCVVTTDDIERPGLPVWTGVKVPLRHHDDLRLLGVDQVYGRQQMAELVTWGATVREIVIYHAKPTSARPMVVVEGVSQAQLLQRAALLLALSWNRATGTGIWLQPQALEAHELGAGSAAQAALAEMTQGLTWNQAALVRLERAMDMSMSDGEPGSAAQAGRSVGGAAEGAGAGVPAADSASRSRPRGPGIKVEFAIPTTGNVTSKPSVVRSVGTGSLYQPVSEPAPGKREILAAVRGAEMAELEASKQAILEAQQAQRRAQAAVVAQQAQAAEQARQKGRQHAETVAAAVQRHAAVAGAAKRQRVVVGQQRREARREAWRSLSGLSSFHQRVNALARHLTRADLHYRDQAVKEIAKTEVEQRRVEDAAVQEHIAELQQRRAEQLHKVAAAVKAALVQDQQDEAAELAEKQQFVQTRRALMQESLKRIGPAGGVWGAAKSPLLLREPLPLKAVQGLAEFWLNNPGKLASAAGQECSMFTHT
ncbi:hypothetical protein WJX72_003790 [[Myrmecia] bisecta]|uniref:Uncharacterized protein n=1 Tax=[Myrmecia] bisecta TaxID=41462 RepID=A0AAW1PGZ3_9CHLO